MSTFEWWWHAPAATSTLFVFAFGACVGSFINVVVHRLPRGMSLHTPPSRCPSCGRRISWHENLPIVGWLLVRGRCWSCGSKVSFEYPAVELGVAALFGAIYLLFFEVRFGPGIGGVTNPWWVDQGPLRAAPAFMAMLAAVGSLVAASLIDARTFLIPAPITTFAAITGFAGIAIQAFMPAHPRAAASGWWAVPLPGWFGTCAALAGMAGLMAAWGLLRAGRLKPSFADYDDYIPPGETFAVYPHARREMVRELVFLFPCVAGMTMVIALQSWLPAGSPPLWLAAIGSSCLGFIVGGGTIWAIRILGTLGFGREAMGMGDVHLMAAAGAALGWAVPTMALVPAIVVALLCTLALRGMALLRKGGKRELPLGPYLAIGVLIAILFRPLLVEGARRLAPEVVPEWAPGLFTNEPPSGAIRKRAVETAPRSPEGAATRSVIQKGV